MQPSRCHSSSLLHRLGLESYKFRLRSAEGTPPILNYIVEEYRDGKQVSSINMVEDLRKRLPPNIPLDRVMPRMPDEAMVRVMFYDRSEQESILQFGYDNRMTTLTFDIDTSVYALHQSRAFDSIPTLLRRRTPIAVRYMMPKGKSLIHCPGMAPVAQIAAMYGHVIVVYVEPVEATSASTQDDNGRQ